MRRVGIGPSLLLASSIGCTTIRGSYTPRGVALPTHRTQAGAAKVDLTPPPGFPMGGYSQAGHVARGYWTRLRARAIYLEDPRGRAIALVACDLWAMPEGLVDRVAELLGEHPNPLARAIGRDQLVLGASHTHHSPASFSTDPFFSTFAGVKPGFDPDLFEFIAHRIADAVVEAMNRRTPARLAWREARAKGVVRNRSLRPFMRNPEAAGVLAANADLDGCPRDLRDPPDVCRAVDPRVRTLVIRALGDDRTIALVGFFASHATALAQATPLYNADVHGIAAILAEQRLRYANSAPVVAFFNGPEGDISPALIERTRDDVVSIARRVVDTTLAPGSERPVDIDTISTRVTSVDLSGACSDVGALEHCTSHVGFPGRATMGGAEDGPSQVRGIAGIWSEGRRHVLALGAQGPKVGALDATLGPIPLAPLTPLVTTLIRPPQVVSLAVHRIGPLVLATLPGEFTTVAGLRIVQSLAQATEVPSRDIVLVGLANGYAYYFATPEEFMLQHYEGSGTLYGRYATEVLQHAIAKLGGEDSELPSPPTRTYEHEVGGRVTFGIRNVSASPSRPGCAIAEAFPGMESAPRFCWDDATPQLDRRRELATPQVTVHRDLPDGRRELAATDDGLEIVVIGAGRQGGSRWCASWVGAKHSVPSAHHYFSVRTMIENGPALWSSCFRPDTLPCAAEQLVAPFRDFSR